MLTDEQRENLTKLSRYLRRLPRDYQKFDMISFYSTSLSKGLVFTEGYLGFAEAECGTTACAVGHGPAAGIPVPDDCMRNERTVAWNEYSSLFAPRFTDVWTFLFGAQWADYDNTPRGAAARIDYVLGGNTRFPFDDTSVYSEFLIC